MIRLLLLLCLPASLFGQLQFALVSGGVEKPVSGFVDLGRVAAGDPLDVRCRLRNIGTVSVVLQTLKISGASYSMSGQPNLPYTAAPGTNIDFTVRFQATVLGSYSANLAINTTSVLMNATAYAAPGLYLGDTWLRAGDTIDFGRVERTTSVSRQVRMRNTSTEGVTLQQVSISGSGFRLEGAPGFPQALAAGQELPLTMILEPTVTGVQSGTLTIDGRSYLLTGFSVDPPFPQPLPQWIDPITSSAQQLKMTVKLASAARVSGGGQLTVEFQPVSGTGDDPGVQFVSSGKRTLAFTVNAGETTVRFGTQTETLVQTGTTAGALLVTVQLGTYREQLSLKVNGSEPVIDSARATRGNGTITLELNGFDNTRTISQMSFTFYDASGAVIAPGAMRLDAAADFRKYYAQSAAGGLFSLQAVFPVTGNVTQIGAVQAEVTNSVGTAKSARLGL